MADKTCVRTTGFTDEFIVDDVLVVTPQGIKLVGEDVQGPAGLAIEGDTLKRVREAAFASHVRICEEPEPAAPSEADAPAPRLTADSVKAADEAPKAAPEVQADEAGADADANATDTSTSATAPGTTRKGR